MPQSHLIIDTCGGMTKREIGMVDRNLQDFTAGLDGSKKSMKPEADLKPMARSVCPITKAKNVRAVVGAFWHR